MLSASYPLKALRHFLLNFFKFNSKANKLKQSSSTIKI